MSRNQLFGYTITIEIGVDEELGPHHLNVIQEFVTNNIENMHTIGEIGEILVLHSRIEPTV